MDKEKKYAAFSIPRHEAQPEKRAFAQVQMRFAETVSDNNAPFADIEYEPFVRAASSLAPAQPIAPRVADPIREKFFAMRSITSGTPFARSDPERFYRQAKFMEDFSDDYRGNAQFFMYYPCYQHMGYEQLRTYFTWRTKARRGEYLPISLTYVFLYLYELLSGVGVGDPADGLKKLLAVWNAYRARERMLNKYLPGWIKDYHIYYSLPQSFADFAVENHLQGYYLDLLLMEADAQNRFALWNGLSSYDVTKSKFYRAGNDVLMQECFSAVLDGIQALCVRRNGSIEDLLFSGIRKGVPWTPFGQALFYPWLEQSDRRVEMPGREVYACKNNQWTAGMPILYADRKEFIGYLMKKTEACLRQAVKHTFQIKANPSAFSILHYKTNRPTLAELDAVIEKTVADFHRSLNQTVVVVKHENLNRIRRDAQNTQDKLIVPEDTAPRTPDQTREDSDAPFEMSLEPSSSDRNGWDALKGALNATEIKALSLILRGSAEIRAFADANGVMLEVLADNINEKAADRIGDSILECSDDMRIYEEYRGKIAEMVG